MIEKLLVGGGVGVAEGTSLVEIVAVCEGVGGLVGDLVIVSVGKIVSESELNFDTLEVLVFVAISVGVIVKLNVWLSLLEGVAGGVMVTVQERASETEADRVSEREFDDKIEAVADTTSVAE